MQELFFPAKNSEPDGVADVLDDLAYGHDSSAELALAAFFIRCDGHSNARADQQSGAHSLDKAHVFHRSPPSFVDVNIVYAKTFGNTIAKKGKTMLKYEKYFDCSRKAAADQKQILLEAGQTIC